MKLTNQQQELLNLMYHVILDKKTSPMERQLFARTKSQIEFGRNFDTEITSLLKELNHITNSPKSAAFKAAAKENGYAVL